MFVFFSIIASALNYITYPILARLVPSNQFVEITVALSLLTQVSAFLSSLVALSIGLTKDSGKKDMPTIHTLQSVIFKIFLFIIAVFCVASPMIMPSLGVSALYAVPVALMLLFSIPTSVISGFYNGKGLLVTLGLVAFLTAAAQFALCVLVAAITHNGLSALIAMGIGQVVSLIIIYSLFKHDNLPKISFKEPARANSRLVRYAAASAVGIMAINLLQVADLLITSARSIDTATYTNLYVISRVVFFAGMILLWPFLSWIDTKHDKINLGAIAKVSGILIGLGLIAVAGMAVFGQFVMEMLFGTVYDQSLIVTSGTLSILYRMFYLLIIMFVLYFTVMRSYWAAVLPAIISCATVAYALLAPNTITLNGLLVGLSLIGLLGTLLCTLAYALCYSGRLRFRADLH